MLPTPSKWTKFILRLFDLLLRPITLLLSVKERVEKIGRRCGR